MAHRTYLVGLYLAEKALARYIERWGVKIQANVPTPTWVCIQAVLAALNECIPLILPEPPVE